MTTCLSIASLGAQGDGIATVEGRPVYVPFTLPGEVVTAARAKDRADLIAVIEPSPQRVAPPCRHFGTCGGCALQHMDMDAYLAWKRAKVVDALRGRGLDCVVADIVPCAPQTRRRAVMAARRTEGGMLLGYYAAMSHRIIDIEECPILRPGIVERLDDLRRLAGLVCATGDAFKIAVTATDTGLDIAVEGAGKLPQPQRLKAGGFAIDNGFARLTVDGEIVVEPVKPAVSFGGAPVEVPPGGFLQATSQAEEAMAGLVVPHLKRAKRVADLFSGAGTFALRLAASSEIHAVEADAAALAALDRGFRFAPGLKRVTAEKRDLFRRPLTFKELNAYDGLIFDPPRAGAEDQSKQIARSGVPLVAAVSCNPVTFARDLGILAEGGYAIRSVTPIDQFLWSPHVEAVALLEKPRKRR